MAYDNVTVLVPSTVETVYGTGMFHIEKPDIYKQNNESSSIVSCIQEVFKLHGDDNRTVEDMKTYLNHYHRLGVDHFIMYASEQTLETSMNDLIGVLREASLHRSSKVTVYLLPSFHHGLVWRQHFTSNHCLYKSKEAAWVLMQYDFDEILIGKGVQDLHSYLSSQPASVDGILVSHYMPEEDHFRPGSTVRISSKSMCDWGKTLFRPKSVNVAWVHAPTNPKVCFFRICHIRDQTTFMLTALIICVNSKGLEHFLGP